MSRDFEFEGVDAVIEREPFDRRPEHRPQASTSTGRPSWFHDLDPVFLHRTLGLQAHEARSRFKSFESVPEVPEKIRDRQFDRFTRSNRTIEIVSYRNDGRRAHGIEDQRDPSRRLVDSLQHGRSVSSRQGGSRKPTKLSHESHVHRTQRLQGLGIKIDRLDRKPRKTSPMSTRGKDPVIRR